MQYVFVIDKNKQPLMPCHPARARELLKTNKAVVYRNYPFTIILKEQDGGNKQPIEIKLDPGSKETGLAIVVEGKSGRKLVWAAVIIHRGERVRDNLLRRRQLRRARRGRKTRYRAARFDNRKHPQDWLPPSLVSRLSNQITWAKRLRRLCPLTSIAEEIVKFDTQLLQNPEISGLEYQQGTLAGYEVREYLLEKWQRKCAYCQKADFPLEIEHINPRSRGGSDRLNNLTLACRECNQEKDNQTAIEFGFPNIQAQAEQSLRDVAAVNTIRWRLYRHLGELGLPVTTGTGGRTKFNRIKQNYPKTHWIDAACVGQSGSEVNIDPNHLPLFIKASGRGSRQMCRPDKYGFPRTSAKASKRVKGFQTGDIVKAIVTSGKKVGTYRGRVAVRASGMFNIGTASGVVQSISHRYCVLIQHSDGYTYQTSQKGEKAFSPHS